MSKVLLVVGSGHEWGRVVAAALSNGWRVLHTGVFEDIPAALERARVDLILLWGCSSHEGWERVARRVWARTEDTPIVACGSGQIHPSLIHSLLGVPTSSFRRLLEDLSPEGGGAAGRREPPASLLRRLPLTATLTLLEPADSPARDGICCAVNYIATHYLEPISLADVARAASYSRCHFCKLFKEQMGKSFVTYLTELRIRHASDLLARSEMPITDIAFEVGFNDLSHFERVFRSIRRQSPSQFRQSAKDPPLPQDDLPSPEAYLTV